MNARAPRQRRPAGGQHGLQPRAWRASAGSLPNRPLDWKRVGLLAGGLLALVFVALLGVGVFSAFQPGLPAKAPPPVAEQRPIVSSSLVGHRPTATPTPREARTPVYLGASPIATSDAAASSAGPLASANGSLAAGPPVAVEDVTPASGALGSRASPANRLPGSPVPASSATPDYTAPTPGATLGQGMSGAIQGDLNGMQATTTALSRTAAGLRPGSSPTPPSASTSAVGQVQPAATDTPIPTAAPPIVPTV